MGVLTSYPDDTTTTADDKYLTVDASGATKQTTAATLKTYIENNKTTGSTKTADIQDDAVTPVKRSGGFKTGAITSANLTSVGSKSITGLGFKPKFIRIYIGFDVAAAGAARECFGVSDGSTTSVRGTAVSGSSQARWSADGVLINIRTEANASVLVANFTSFNADGFTFNVTTADGSYSGYYEAYA